MRGLNKGKKCKGVEEYKIKCDAGVISVCKRAGERVHFKILMVKNCRQTAESQ